MNGNVSIHVVRHGATEMNNQTDLSQDRIRGHLDVPLAPQGEEEARQAAETLKSAGIQVIVTSRLIRAVQTAKIISEVLGGIPTQVNPNLVPWNLGDLQGTSTKEALPKIAYYATQEPDTPVPGGESFNQFKERAFQGLAEAIQVAGGRPLCIVTHHRDERLYKAWEAVGEPSDHSIDLDTFLQKGDPPGGVYEMNVNPAALAPVGGAPTMPPGAPVGPGQASPMPPGVPSSPGLPVPGQPPGAPAAAQPPQPNPMFAMLAKLQQIQKAIQLLRDDVPRGYRVDIEVDTMVAGDQQVERQDATEFLKAVTTFVTAAGQIAMINPDFAPLAGKMLQFGVRKFRVGRELESSIDEYVDKVTKNPPKMPPQQPGKAGAGPHDAMIAQAKVKSEQVRSQAEIAKATLETKAAQSNDQREQQLKLLEFQLKTKEFQMRMAEMEREEQFKIAEHNRKMQQHAVSAIVSQNRGLNNASGLPS